MGRGLSYLGGIVVDLTGGFDEFAPWVERYGLTAPYGECQCGCGEKTNIYHQNSTFHGHKKGHPVRFIHGHVHRERPDLIREPTVNSW